jgi:hypothetical protein
VRGVRETNVPKPKQNRNFGRNNSFLWGDLLRETNWFHGRRGRAICLPETDGLAPAAGNLPADPPPRGTRQCLPRSPAGPGVALFGAERQIAGSAYLVLKTR